MRSELMGSRISDEYYHGAELIALAGDDPEMMGFLSLMFPFLATRFVAKKVIKKANPKLAAKIEAKRKQVLANVASPFKKIGAAIAARKAAKAQAAEDAAIAQAEAEDATSAAPEGLTTATADSMEPTIQAAGFTLPGVGKVDKKVLYIGGAVAIAGLLLTMMPRRK